MVATDSTLRDIDDAETHSRDFDEFRRFINTQRQRFWHVHFAKKTQHPKATINYLGRYLKRPLIAGAKLAHYRGEANQSFRYLDHHTGKYETEEISQLKLIKRLIQHIPEKNFRMIRYFVFLPIVWLERSYLKRVTLWVWRGIRRRQHFDMVR